LSNENTYETDAFYLLEKIVALSIIALMDKDKNTLPVVKFKGRILVIDNNSLLKECVADLMREKYIGLDTETKPSFKKGETHPLALIQLASEDRAYIVKAQKISELHLLAPIFESDKIVKIGLALRDDIKSIQKLFPFDPQQFIELQSLAKEKNLKNFGLKGMTEEILHQHLSKKAKLTNWEKDPLSIEQLTYAALDAWICLKLFQKLKEL